MEDTHFHHSIPIQLRFNDFDVLGHVNNSVYFSFYDIGKTEYFSKVLPQIIENREVGLVIASIHVDFKLPVFPNEQVEVLTAITEIGEKSFKILQHLVDSETRELKSVCRTVMVGYNASTKASQEISKEWKEAIANFEGVRELAF